MSSQADTIPSKLKARTTVAILFTSLPKFLTVLGREYDRESMKSQELFYKFISLYYRGNQITCIKKYLPCGRLR